MVEEKPQFQNIVRKRTPVARKWTLFCAMHLLINSSTVTYDFGIVPDFYESHIESSAYRMNINEKGDKVGVVLPFTQ